MKFFFQISLLTLCGFGCIEASQSASSSRDYFSSEVKQSAIKKAFLNLFGARSLTLSDELINETFRNCPDEVNAILARIKQNVLSDSEKNIILHGPLGAGKSTIAVGIAQKCEIPYFIYNVRNISMDYPKLGIQSLSEVFKLVLSFEKPCIVILDELETLIKKNTVNDSSENDFLVNFWQELDKLNTSNVIFIGTMNSTQGLPVEIASRATTIQMSLPNQRQREETLEYHTNIEQKKHNLIMPIQGIDFRYISKKMKGFDYSEIKSVVEKTTTLTSINKNSKELFGPNFIQAAQSIKNNPQRKKCKEMGTWKHTIKKGDVKGIAYPLLTVAGLYIGYNQLNNSNIQTRNSNTQTQNSNQQLLISKSSNNWQKVTGSMTIAAGLGGGGVATLAAIQATTTAGIAAKLAAGIAAVPPAAPFILGGAAVVGLATLAYNYHTNK